MAGLITLVRRYERRRRFWRQVQVRAPDECWIWLGPVDVGGVGRHGRGTAATRAFELAKGPLPDGLTPIPTCGVPACVNPRHLHAPVPSGALVRPAARA